MKNATCVLPQPGKHIANVLHCVNKLLQVFTISFIFLSFNCYGLRLERTAQVVEAHAIAQPKRERESIKEQLFHKWNTECGLPRPVRGCL